MSKFRRRSRGLFSLFTSRQPKSRNRRNLLTEHLENRNLMAGDFLQNPWNKFDVSGDGNVSPLDVLLGINSYESPHGEDAPPIYVDVNGDGFHSPVDELNTINRLETGIQGEGGSVMAYTPIALASTVTGPFRFGVEFFDNGANDTIVRSDAGGSWVADGYAAGGRILISDSGEFRDIDNGQVIGQDQNGNDILGDPDPDIHVHNNGVFTIQSVTPTTITLTSSAELVNFNGNNSDINAIFFRPITSIGTNSNFIVGMLAEDLRTMDAQGNPISPTSKGPFAAFVDSNFDTSLVSATGTNLSSFTFHNRLSSTASGNFTTPGLLDEVGGVAFSNPGSSPTGAGQHLAWRTNFQSGNTTGAAVFSTNAADVVPAHDSLLFGVNAAVPTSMIDFNTVTLTIASDIAAVNDTAGVVENSTGTTIDVLANDIVNVGTASITQINGTNIAVGNTANVNNGTVRNDGDEVTFTPTTGFSGQTTFTYTISNGLGASSSATVTVTVGPVNDAPVNTLGGARSTNEDTALAVTGVSVADPDADQGTAPALQVTLSVVSGTLSTTNTAATVSGTGTNSLVISGSVANVNASLGGLTYTPNQNFSGNDTLTMATTDNGNTGTGGTKTDTDSVTIAVAAVNDAPVNTVPGAQTVFVNTNLTFNTANSNLISTADVDAAGSSVQLTLTVSQGSLTLASTAGLTNVTGNNSATVSATGTLASVNTALNGLVFAPPSASFVGQSTLTITVNDQGATGSGGAKSDTDTVLINVVPPTRPFAASDTLTVAEDSGNTNIDVLANDLFPEDVTAQTITQVNGSTGTTVATAHGTVTRNGNNLTYRPTDKYFGPDSFTYQLETTPVEDGPSVGTVAITVTPVNDGPTLTAPTTATVNEDASLAFTGASDISVADIDADASGGVQVNLSVTNGNLNVTPGSATVTGNGGSTVTISGLLSAVNTALNSLTFSPTAQFNGAASLNVSVTDNGNTGGGALTATATVAITVNAINDNPTIAVPGPQTAITNFDNLFSAANGNVITVADIDAGSDPINVRLSINDPNAALTLSSTAGLTVTGNGTNNVSITGPINGINAALNGLNYRTTAAGNFTLSVTANDQGNNGLGGGVDVTATIAIEALAFVPSTISGFVFLDNNGNGVRDANEGIADVEVALTGSDFQGNAVNLTATTDSIGRYNFNNIRPHLAGTPYLLRENQPANTVDGPDTAAGGATIVDDDLAQVTIGIQGNVNATVDFAETSLEATFISGTYLLASAADDGPLGSGMLFSSDGDDSWSAFFGSAWASFSNAQLTMNAAGDTATIRVNNGAQLLQCTVTRDSGRIEQRTDADGDTVITIFGRPSDLNFTAVAQAEGEGGVDPADLFLQQSAEQYAESADIVFAEEAVA